MSNDSPREQQNSPGSDELFRLMVESVKDYAIFAIDTEGRIVSWNPGVERLLGYGEAEFVGRHVSLLFTPEDLGRGADLEEMRQAVSAGRAEDQRWHVRCDGSRFWANGFLTSLRDESGSLRGFAKVMRDDTQRKRAEEERERFLALGSDLLVTAGFDGYFKWVSPAWERTFGWTAEELTAHPWLFFTHPEDQERTIKEAQKLFEGHETVAFENRYKCKDGSYRWVSWNTKPYPQERLLYCAATDITERKEAEETLRESERRLRTLADAVPQLVWMAEPDGYIFWYNQRWYDYTGTTPAEMQGWGWQRVHDPAMLPQVLKRWQGSIRTGEPFEMEFPLRGRDGLYRWFLTRVNPLRDAAGRVVRWFGTNTDIDEQRRAAEQLREAGRMKDEFLATLSHELRTPLTSILGWSRLLTGDELEDAHRARAVESIARNAKAQAQLIEDLLDVSRIITGKLRLDVRPFELAPVIEAAIDSVRPAAEAKGIRLQVLLDPRAGQVSGDPDRIQQVVWNLLSNAIKYTPKGGRVQVHLQRIDSHAEITVSDTGQGISREFLPHIFERFRQADSSITREQGGLGLGLAIVRHLVESHGGTVEAASPGAGKGATFRVKLPLLIVHDRQRFLDTDVERRHPLAGAGEVVECPPALDGLRVLAVDDERDARELITMMLERCGAEVSAVASGGEALEALKERRPDVLVSDIGMPGMDGYALMSTIRALPAEQGGRTPAVALTAYARTEDRVRAFSSGYQVHVAKPFEPIELVTAVASVAGRAGSARGT